jgi:hypothetical protein
MFALLKNLAARQNHGLVRVGGWAAAVPVARGGGGLRIHNRDALICWRPTAILADATGHGGGAAIATAAAATAAIGMTTMAAVSVAHFANAGLGAIDECARCTRPLFTRNAALLLLKNSEPALVANSLVLATVSSTHANVRLVLVD